MRRQTQRTLTGQTRSVLHQHTCTLTYMYSHTRMDTCMHSTVQHSTAQHSTAQHSTAQHSTAQHSTAQHSTAQHSLPWVGCDCAASSTQVCPCLVQQVAGLDLATPSHPTTPHRTAPHRTAPQHTTPHHTTPHHTTPHHTTPHHTHTLHMSRFTLRPAYETH